jgi:hypothetical protein|tara:strand:- start:864 stop:992 length:129 start_codon:yes stop_codon:yes gene_type:complete
MSLTLNGDLLPPGVACAETLKEIPNNDVHQSNPPDDITDYPT